MGVSSFIFLRRCNIRLPVELFEHQINAVNKLQNGNILVGGVGTGKSRTALAYYYLKECEGDIQINGKGGYSPMKNPKDLYIITTARKRDTLEWEQECELFSLYKERDKSVSNVSVIVDSWNNIRKYIEVKNAFFIFDEQRVIGNGVWVKSFLKITQNNNWILLTATPGDTWMDYVPVFLANKFYKNRTEFIRRHVIYKAFSRYPKIEKYVEVGRLIKLRDSITVTMKYRKKTITHEENINVPFDKEKLNTIFVKRWNFYENRPVKDISEMCFLMRKVVNSDPRRLEVVVQLLKKHKKAIIFYNFNYERELLYEMAEKIKIPIAEWSGHKHEPIPKTDQWVYIVQYNAGAEGWNCIDTNVIIFYSQNYSYKMTVQAAGRIDRLNTPFEHLYYYYLRSQSYIDLAIKKAFEEKRDFNESYFLNI